MNIGPRMSERLEQIGIQSKEDFLNRDPYEVFYEMLIKLDPTLCRCALASIAGAKEGIPWHKITKQAAKEFDLRYPKHKWLNHC